MYKMTVDLKGLEKVTSGLSRVADGLERGLVDALLATGVTVRRTMKQNAPVDTGNLKRSIGYKVNKPALEVIIGPDQEKAPYAPYVEYGHHTRSGSFVQGQFYVRKTKQEVNDAVQDLFADMVREVTNKF